MTLARRVALGAVAALVFAGFIALGIWQVERRAWKHALIERVDARVHAAPVAAPAPAEWPQVSAARDEYRRVLVSGQWVPDADTRVQASTALGAGWWLLTPLRQADGSVVIVNRGFVPTRSPSARIAGDARVVGLLRLSEPGGGFLRRNDPAAERWYSRDVAVIGAARRLDRVAPFFVDAQAQPAAAAEAPVGGLTVIAFHDNHLAYALTWFTLAAMAAAAALTFWRLERRSAGFGISDAR